MKIIHKIKELAESNHLFGTELTKEQVRIIKKTKYGSLLRDDVNKGKFEKLFENALTTQPKTEEKSKGKYQLYLGLQKKYLTSLVNELEDMFDLGLDNTSTQKYKNVDVKPFKNRIEKFIIKNDKMNDTTRKELKRIVYDMDSVPAIMYHLYHICSCK
jgi:hypothetical protein